MISRMGTKGPVCRKVDYKRAGCSLDAGLPVIISHLSGAQKKSCVKLENIIYFSIAIIYFI